MSTLPSVDNVQNYTTDEVIDFLRNESKSFNDDDFNILRRERVSGRALLRMTKEDLINPPYNFPGGPALEIVEIVESLNSQKQPVAEQSVSVLKRQIDEMEERMEGKMDNISRDIKKVRFNSEVLWGSAPVTDSDTLSKKGTTIRSLIKNADIEFPFELTKTAQKRVYGKFENAPTNCPEKELQEYFINECRPLNTKKSKLVVEDVHSVPLLATRKPDFVFIAKDRPLDALHVVAVGEIKNRSGKEFTNADVGQAITFGEKVLQLQPRRAYVYVVLTDCINIDIYKVTRVTYNSNNSDNIRFFYGHISKEPLCYPSLGWKHLVTILECNPNDLGWLEPSLKFNSDTVMLVRSINTGRTSNVYEGKFVGRDVVVKLAKSEEYLSCFEKEKAVLESIDSPHIPKLHLYDEKSLVITPLGMKVKSMKKKDIKNIIETLKIVHEKNIVHMDLRRYNFIRDHDEKIIIIDWGYSATKNEIGNFAGALECMPDDILKSLVDGVQITYEPRIDLICLVRSFYLMLHKPASTTMSFDKTPDFKSRAKNVLTFWSSHGNSNFWQNIYKEANNLNYDNLIKELEVLF